MPTTSEKTQINFDELKKDYGNWTAHNIYLGDDRYTIGREVNQDQRKLARFLQAVTDFSRKPISDMRVLDLACLEGLYSIEFARQGAQVVGIEGRKVHIEKARGVASILGLDNVEFVQGDVRDISVERYGKFDLILCLGILYHINAPDVFELMHKMGSMCEDSIIVDTHIALKPKIKYEHKGQTYQGLNYYEYSPRLSKERIEGAVWASLNNADSFWPTKSALLNLIQHSKFTSVVEIMSPYSPKGGCDRVVFLAKKGNPVAVISAPRVDVDPPHEWPDKEPEFCHPYQSSWNVFVRRCMDLIPQAIRDQINRMRGRR